MVSELDGVNPVRFNFELMLRSDFSDIFEAEMRNFMWWGRIETRWDDERGELNTTYVSGDFYRSLEVALAPGATWHTCGYYTLRDNLHVRTPIDVCYREAVESELDDQQRQWLASATDVTISNDDMYRLYCQSVVDIGALLRWACPDSNAAANSVMAKTRTVTVH